MYASMMELNEEVLNWALAFACCTDTDIPIKTSLFASVNYLFCPWRCVIWIIIVGYNRVGRRLIILFSCHNFILLCASFTFVDRFLVTASQNTVSFHTFFPFREPTSTSSLFRWFGTISFWSTSTAIKTTTMNKFKCSEWEEEESSVFIKIHTPNWFNGHLHWQYEETPQWNEISKN